MRWRKKPEIVEAIQWNGSNWHQMLEFCGKGNVATDGKDLFLRKFVPEHGKEAPEQQVVPVGAWVRSRGEGTVFDFVSDTVMKAQYEPVEEEDS